MEQAEEERFALHEGGSGGIFSLEEECRGPHDMPCVCCVTQGTTLPILRRNGKQSSRLFWAIVVLVLASLPLAAGYLFLALKARRDVSLHLASLSASASKVEVSRLSVSPSRSHLLTFVFEFERNPWLTSARWHARPWGKVETMGREVAFVREFVRLDTESAVNLVLECRYWDYDEVVISDRDNEIISDLLKQEGYDLQGLRNMHLSVRHYLPSVLLSLRKRRDFPLAPRFQTPVGGDRREAWRRWWDEQLRMQEPKQNE